MVRNYKMVPNYEMVQNYEMVASTYAADICCASTRSCRRMCIITRCSTQHIIRTNEPLTVRGLISQAEIDWYLIFKKGSNDPFLGISEVV